MRDYHDEYNRVNTLLGQLAEQAVQYIDTLGFSARTSAVAVKVVDGDGATSLAHKTVATRAGLGWIGAGAPLVTPEPGAAVRPATVLTEAPLVCGDPIDVSRCGSCSSAVTYFESAGQTLVLSRPKSSESTPTVPKFAVPAPRQT